MDMLRAVPDAVLDRLLDVDLDHDPVTAHGLSNHLPMALMALRHLGASDTRLRGYADLYAQRLVATHEPFAPIDRLTWSQRSARERATPTGVRCSNTR